MASKRVVLRWTGDGQEFRGAGPDGGEMTVDGSGAAGPSPMDGLLLSLAGCMAVDVLAILAKSRVPVEALEVEVEGERAEAHPRRYTALRLEYRVRGPTQDHRPRLERAVALSRDTYCSVLHSLHPDLNVEIAIRTL